MYYEDQTEEDRRQWEPCEDCDGTGTCSECNGAGELYDPYMGIDVECPSCAGLCDCWNCGGEGWFG